MFRFVIALALCLPTLAYACGPRPARYVARELCTYAVIDAITAPRSVTMTGVELREITPRLYEAKGSGIQLVPCDRAVAQELSEAAHNHVKVSIEGHYVAPKVVKVEKVVVNYGIGFRRVKRPLFPININVNVAPANINAPIILPPLFPAAPACPK